MNYNEERIVFEQLLFYGKSPTLLAHDGRQYTNRNTRRMFGAWIKAKQHAALVRQTEG